MKRNIIKIILSILLICLICIAGYKIYDMSKHNPPNNTYTADESVSNAEKSAVSKNSENMQCPISVDFDKLNEINSDTAAWIYSDDTQISSPVVFGVDNSEYRYKTFGGYLNDCGTIHLDFQNSRDFSDLKNIIYDDNPNSNALFSEILKYDNQKYYDEHPSLWLITPDKTYELEIISGYDTFLNSDDFSLVQSKTDLNDYIETASEKSQFKSNADLSTIKNIVVLSACQAKNNDPNARFILVTSIKQQ